jgi:hypothetical protein
MNNDELVIEDSFSIIPPLLINLLGIAFCVGLEIWWIYYLISSLVSSETLSIGGIIGSFVIVNLFLFISLLFFYINFNGMYFSNELYKKSFKAQMPVLFFKDDVEINFSECKFIETIKFPNRSFKGRYVIFRLKDGSRISIKLPMSIVEKLPKVKRGRNQ